MTKRYDYWRIGDGYFEIFDLPRDGRVPVARISSPDVLLVEKIVDCLNKGDSDRHNSIVIPPSALYKHSL